MSKLEITKLDDFIVLKEKEKRLHADAINVFKRTDLLPSELEKQRDELLKTLTVINPCRAEAA